jgi:hypothetical protein
MAEVTDKRIAFPMARAVLEETVIAEGRRHVASAGTPTRG